MEKENSKGLMNYSLAQELWNAISHGLGALFGVAALVLLIIKINMTTSIDDSMYIVKMFSAIFYSISIIICMSISTIYHSLKKNKGKKVLRVIDHAMIYLLIAGSYLPYCLVAMHDEPFWGIDATKGMGGYIVLAICYILMIVGVTFSSINIHKYSTLSMIMYVFGGLSILINPVSAFNGLGASGFILLSISGLIYVIGSALYGLGKKKSLWWHTVFHIFILVAIVIMFISIYVYVY